MPKTLEMFYLHVHSLSNMTSNFSLGVYLNILYKVQLTFWDKVPFKLFQQVQSPLFPAKHYHFSIYLSSQKADLVSDFDLRPSFYLEHWLETVQSIQINEVILGKEVNFTPHCIIITTVFVDTRFPKTKHPRKRFQNFLQSYMLSTDRIEIHQSQPASMT